MLDYIVVGLGLAGISFCEVLEKEGKTFRVISDQSQTSSLVAGGLYNPVILKRFTLAWNAGEQMDLALPFYANLEQKLGVKLDYKLRVLRRFVSSEEQNKWFEAADRPGLDRFLSTTLVANANSSIDAPFGYGEVLHTGRIDTSTLLSTYSAYLAKKGVLVQESFDFSCFKSFSEHVSCKSINAKQIVFAEGYGLKNNPFFNYLPLNGTKGELLTIKASDLMEENVIKSSVFIIPIGADLYRIGATYNWKDKTNPPTEKAREELQGKLRTFLKCDFEVVNHVAGIRPTVVDRRPLVGQHPKYNGMYVLNGFGSRGVLVAPNVSNSLFNAIESGVSLRPEIDIERFTKKYY